MNLTAVPKRSLSARIRNIRGDTFVANERRAFQLSDVAATVWGNIDGRRTGEEIVALVAEEYEVDAEMVATDVSDLLDHLYLDELVEVVKSEAGTEA